MFRRRSWDGGPQLILIELTITPRLFHVPDLIDSYGRDLMPLGHRNWILSNDNCPPAQIWASWRIVKPLWYVKPYLVIMIKMGLVLPGLPLPWLTRGGRLQTYRESKSLCSHPRSWDRVKWRAAGGRWGNGEACQNGLIYCYNILHISFFQYGFN